MATFTKILGYSKDTKSFNNIACDSNGAMSVNVLNGGGTGGGTASDTNQLIQIGYAQGSNVILADINNKLVSCDTDGLSTAINQINSNLAQWEKLNLIEQGTEINAGFLQSIDFKATPLQQGIATYTIDAISTLSTGTTPAYKAPPAGIQASEGWYYKNLSAGNASQLYYYGNNSTQTQNHDYTLSSIESQWAVVRYLALNSSVGIAYLVVYSQPEGTGDFIPGFARSRLIYQIATGQDLRLGEKIIIYRGTQPDSRIFPELRRVECSLTVSNGPCLSSELLAYASLNSDSGALVGNAEYIVSGAGLSFAGDNVYKVELTGESSVSTAGDASAVNQVSSNTAVCSRLDASNVVLTSIDSSLNNIEIKVDNLKFDTSSNLFVYDPNSVAELITIRDILADSVNTKLFAQLYSDPTTSIPIYGNNGNLFVYDSQTNISVVDVKNELVTLNSTYEALIDGTSSMYVKIDGTDDAIQVWGYNPVDAMPEAIYTTDHAVQAYITNSSVDVTGTVSLAEGAQVNLVNSTVGLETGTSVAITGDVAVTGTFWQATQPVSIADSVAITSATALSVTESNPITGFSLETTQTDIKTQTDKLTFVDVESNTNNLKVIDLVNNAILSQLSFFTNEDTVTDLRVRVMNPIEVRNPTGETLTVSGNVGLVAEQTVGITGSVQTHCFASSNGTDWHHLASDANGRINTNSRTHDGSGNDISSTSVSGTESYRGLDVVCKGAVSVQNVSSTQIAVKTEQYGYYGNLLNNVATILPAGVSSGLDVSAWAYFIGSYEDYYAGMPGTGSLRLQYSFDNTTYYDLFGTTISPGGVSTPRTATIQKQDIPSINWIRFKNDSSVTLASVTITLLGASI